MKFIKVLTWAMWSLAFTLTALPGLAADYPAPREGDWIVRDFRFHTGDVLPELRLLARVLAARTAPGAIPNDHSALLPVVPDRDHGVRAGVSHSAGARTPHAVLSAGNSRPR